MEVANASMYDGSTGTGEAVLMAHRVTKRRKAVLSGGLHPQYADVVKTLSAMANDAVVAAPLMSPARKISRSSSTTRPPASWCRTRMSSAISAISARWQPRRRPRARC